MKPNDFLIGWVYYDILRNRIDDKDVDNHKQEWIVEKNENDHTLRFQSNYRIGEYLTGDLLYDGDWELSGNGNWRCRCYFHWLYVGSENPTWWKIIPSFPS